MPTLLLFCTPPFANLRKYVLDTPRNPRRTQSLDSLYKTYPSDRFPNTPLHLRPQPRISSHLHLKFPPECVAPGDLTQSDAKLSLVMPVQDLFEAGGETGHHVCPSMWGEVLFEDCEEGIRVVLCDGDVREVVKEGGV